MNSELEKKYHSRLPELIRVFQALANFNNLSDLLDYSIQSVSRLAEAERASLFLVDDRKSELYSEVAEGTGDQEIRFPIGKGIAGSVAQSCETILIPDAYSDPRFNPDVDRKTGFVTQNILCMPMQNIEGRVIGVIQVLNKKSGFDAVDQEILKSFCSHAAVCIESTLLFTKMEELVQQRTAELASALHSNRMILSNIRDGFLILNPQLCIQSGYSDSCESLFSTTCLESRKLTDLHLRPANELEGDSLAQMDSWLRFGFENPEMENWEELAGLRLKKEQRTLELSFQRIFENQSVVACMTLIEDITERLLLEKRIAQSQKQAQETTTAVSAIVQLGATEFKELLSDLQQLCTALKALNPSACMDTIDELFRHAHTLKGHTMAVHLDYMAQSLHTIEDELAMIRRTSKNPEEPLLEAIQSFNDQVELTQRHYESIFGHLQKNYQIQISHSLWKQILPTLPRELLIKALPSDSQSLQNLAQKLEDETGRLGDKLQREVDFQTELHPALLKPEVVKTLHGCLLHLIRNSLDHGIEDPESRLQRNKSARGILKLSSRPREQDFRIQLEDDGKGIDTQSVLHKAKQTGLTDNTSKPTEDQILDFLFQPGFSTRHEVSQTSGRGVGLDAVRTDLAKINATIRLQTQLDRGTQFEIRIPLEYVELLIPKGNRDD